MAIFLERHGKINYTTPVVDMYCLCNILKMLVYYTQEKYVTENRFSPTPPDGTTCLLLPKYDDNQIQLLFVCFFSTRR